MTDKNTEIEKLIAMFQSPKADVRYGACELLRVAPTLTPEAIAALQEILNDPDPNVAEAAQRALSLHLTPEVRKDKPVELKSNPQIEEARRAYRWLWFSPIFTVPTMAILWWNDLGYEILCRNLFSCNDDLWEWIAIASAIMLPSLWHLVLLVQVLSEKRTFVRWHGWQALMLAGIRTAIPLCFVLADLWIRTNDTRQGSYRSGYNNIYQLAFFFVFVIYVAGTSWGQTQAVAGDCWLMRKRGMEKDLPNLSQVQSQPTLDTDLIYTLEDSDGQ